MKIEQIRRALEIYNTGSINRAAQNLFMAQSSLSSSIRALEAELAEEIFARSQEGVSLTPFGQQFIDHAREIIRHVEQIERLSAGGLQENVAPRLDVIVYYLLFASHAWTQLCNRYKNEAIQLNYMERTRSEIITAVAGGKAELGLVMMPSVDREQWLSLFSAQGIDYTVITIEPVYAILGPNSDLFHNSGASLSLRDLAHHKMIIFPEENELFQAIDRKIFKKFAPSGYLSVCDRGSLTAILNETNGYYLGTYNKKAYSRVPYYGSLKIMPVVGTDFHYEIGYVKAHACPLSECAREYLGLVQQLVW